MPLEALSSCGTTVPANISSQSDLWLTHIGELCFSPKPGPVTGILSIWKELSFITFGPFQSEYTLGHFLEWTQSRTSGACRVSGWVEVGWGFIVAKFEQMSKQAGDATLIFPVSTKETLFFFPLLLLFCFHTLLMCEFRVCRVVFFWAGSYTRSSEVNFFAGSKALEALKNPFGARGPKSSPTSLRPSDVCFSFGLGEHVGNQLKAACQWKVSFGRGSDMCLGESSSRQGQSQAASRLPGSKKPVPLEQVMPRDGSREDLKLLPSSPDCLKPLGTSIYSLVFAWMLGL